MPRYAHCLAADLARELIGLPGGSASTATVLTATAPSMAGSATTLDGGFCHRPSTACLLVDPITNPSPSALFRPPSSTISSAAGSTLSGTFSAAQQPETLRTCRKRSTTFPTIWPLASRSSTSSMSWPGLAMRSHPRSPICDLSSLPTLTTVLRCKKCSRMV